MATRAELEAELAARDREPVLVSHAVAVPIMVTGGIFTIAVLYLAAQRVAGSSGTFSPAWLAIPAAVAWLIAHSEGSSYFAPTLYGYGPRGCARALAAIVGAAAASWLVWTGEVGPAVTWPYLVMGTLAISPLWWALLWYAERKLRDPAPVVTAPGSPDPGMPWPQILERATEGTTKLTEVTPHRAGVKLTIEPGRYVDEDGVERDEDVTFDDFARCADRFATLASATYRRRTGERMPLNCARPEPGRDDAEFTLHVTMRNVFGEHTVFVPADGPQTIATPKDLGEYEDATRIMVTLLSGHAKIVGHTGSGKSVEANNWIARVTECTDALVWVCATDKLVPLIFPWLRSWFEGRSVRPALDYVAGQSIDNMLGMLADAYRLCCERNARLTDESQHTPTPEEPAVFVFVEELSHSVEFDATIETHDNMECDVSTLIMLIARAGRSAAVRLVLMSQTALNSSSGDCAAEIIRNLQIRVCLRTMESHDGTRTIPALNNVDTTQIPIYTKIVQPSIEQPRAMPGKAPELDGTKTIDAIAVRNAGWRPAGVEAESRLGERYADRWNPERLLELARAVAKHGLTWRVPSEHAGPAWNIIDGGDSHQEGGPAVDANEYNVMIDTEDVEEERFVGGFRFPNGDRELARLKELAAEISAKYPKEPGEEPMPVPPPLDAVIDWIDEQDDPADFYLTEALARGIGHPDPIGFSRELFAVVGVRSRNARASEDSRKRKGHDVATLREAAARHRFGM